MRAMGRRFDARAKRALGSFGTPLLYAAGAIVLAMVVPRLEARYLPDLTSGAGASAAIAVLSAIASGMMPLTGLVFSLAFVMVQFSATAYSPRLVSWLAGSAIMNHSLGIFTGTFIYALGALAWVDRGGSARVPLLTIWVAIVLMMVSVVFFVMLVERLGMLQIARVLAYAGDQGRAMIERNYVRLEGRETDEAKGGEELPAVTQVLVHRGGPAVIQSLDIRGLVALAAQGEAVVAMALAVGDTAVEGMPCCASTGARGHFPSGHCGGWSDWARSARSSRTPSMRSASSSTSRSKRSPPPSTIRRPRSRRSTRSRTS
jgi:uncharacterized membrane protein